MLNDGAIGLAGDSLRREAAELDREAEQLTALARGKRAEAGKLRARADRVDDPVRSVRVTTTARDRARHDGLLAAAGVEVESLPAGFVPADLAAALGIRDETRALRLVLALAEYGKVARHGDGGWMAYDAEEARVRDYIVGRERFAIGDMIADLGMAELDAAYYVERFCSRGMLSGQGGFYAYAEPVSDAPTSRPRRRPPELEPPAGADAPKRGEPIRIVDHGKAAKAGGKHQMKVRQTRYERQQAAKDERAEQQRAQARRRR